MNKNTRTKTTSFPISIKGTADLIKRQIELDESLSPIDFLIRFLASINEHAKTLRLIEALRESEAYNQAACSFIEVLTDDKDIDEEKLELARKLAPQLQGYITSSVLCPCHQFAELEINIARATKEEVDIDRARSTILGNGSIHAKAKGLLQILYLTKNQEDEALIRGVISERHRDSFELAEKLLTEMESEQNFLLYCETLEWALSNNPEGALKKIYLQKFSAVMKRFRRTLRRVLQKTSDESIRALLLEHIPQGPTSLTSN